MEQYSADDNILFFLECIVDLLGIFHTNIYFVIKDTVPKSV